MSSSAGRSAPAADTRSRLVTAARTVIEGGGYGEASVLAIADQAGVAAGTLYRHFSSKAELFVEVFRVVCGHELHATEQAAAHAAASGDPLGALDAIITVFAERALARPTLAWSLIAEPVDPAVERVRLEFRSNYRRTVASYLQAAIDAGLLPAQDADLTAAALVGAANEILAGPLAAAHGHQDRSAVTAALRTVWSRAAGGNRDPALAGNSRS